MIDQVRATTPKVVCTSVAEEVSIIRLHDLPPDRLGDLVGESEKAGFRFLRRLVDDWEGGSRFYVVLGFKRCDGEADCTHAMELGG